VGELPPSFIGAWRRTDLTVGGLPKDDADVLWLQGAAWYADVRIPHQDHGGPVEAFAGTAHWADPHFTWAHDLDWLGSFPEDVGHLAWDGDVLVETGSFDVDGEQQPYAERWVRDAGTDTGPRLVAVTVGEPGIVAIRVGSEAIVVASGEGTFAVRRDRIEAGGVKAAFAREADRQPLPAFPFASTWAVGDRVTYDGSVVEIIDV
jgi:hypothetical protein